MATEGLISRRAADAKRRALERTTTLDRLWERFLTLLDEEGYDPKQIQRFRRARNESAKGRYMAHLLSRGVPAGWWWESPEEFGLLGMDVDFDPKPCQPTTIRPGTRAKVELYRLRYVAGQAMNHEDDPKLEPGSRRDGILEVHVRRNRKAIGDI